MCCYLQRWNAHDRLQSLCVTRTKDTVANSSELQTAPSAKLCRFLAAPVAEGRSTVSQAHLGGMGTLDWVSGIHAGKCRQPQHNTSHDSNPPAKVEGETACCGPQLLMKVFTGAWSGRRRHLRVQGVCDPSCAYNRCLCTSLLCRQTGRVRAEQRWSMGEGMAHPTSCSPSFHSVGNPSAESCASTVSPSTMDG